MTSQSVKKKMKQPSFAAAVSRDDMRLGAEELGEDFDAHLAFVIAALEPRAEELGLTGEVTSAGCRRGTTHRIRPWPSSTSPSAPSLASRRSTS